MKTLQKFIFRRNYPFTWKQSSFMLSTSDVQWLAVVIATDESSFGHFIASGGNPDR
jgi:hypothetical protein